jgi:hypothetical protein
MDSWLRPPPPALLSRNALPHYVNGFTLVLSTFFQVLAEELLRLSVLVLLGIQLEHTRGPRRGVGRYIGPSIHTRVVDRDRVGSGGRGGRSGAGVRPALALQGRPPAVLQS